MEKFGIKIVALSETKAIIERKTSESEARVEVEFGNRRRCAIKTQVEFLSHMLQTLAWNCGFNLKLTYTAKSYKLTHVVFEDTGIILGRALREVLVKRIAASGVNARGANARGLVVDLGILDEAGVLVGISVEGRPEFNLVSLNRGMRVKEILSGGVEDARACDLDDFLKGFALGMGASVNVYLLSGKDPHHLWESVFRGLGCALEQAFEKNEFRKGACAGVKETMG